MTPRSGDDEFHAAGIGQRPDEEPANEPDPESLSRSSFAKTMSKAAAAGPSLSSIKTVMMLSRKQRQAKRKVAQDELAKENQGMAVHKRAFQLLVLTLVPVIAFGVVFTEMGFGHECYRAIATQSSLAKPIQMVCLVTIVVLYVLDFGYWDSGSSNVVRTILIAAIAAAICLSTVRSRPRQASLHTALRWPSLPLPSAFPAPAPAPCLRNSRELARPGRAGFCAA